MRTDYKKLLQESKDKKFGLLEEARINHYECNHSQKDKCVACTHPNWCIFSEERIQYENKLANLKHTEKDLKEYLKNGEGTRDYDKNKIKQELLITQQELKKLAKKKVKLLKSV